MELRNEVYIAAPVHRVWEAIGERFMHVSEWAAPITSSCSLGPSEPEVGVVRSCTIAAFGPFAPGVVEERLTRFDREHMTLEYEALAGMPGFVEHAVNRWSVEGVDGGRSLVRIHATLTLRGPAKLLGCLIQWQLRSGGARVAEELKHFVEQAEPHPRKLAAEASKRSSR